MATTDQVTNSAVFGSTDNHRNRLSNHIPWSSGITFFDQGYCCGAPARLYATVPIPLTEAFLWHFIGLPGLQAVVRNGDTLFSDAGAGTYNVTASSQFVMANWPYLNYSHHGRVFEAIFYQTALNNAQRRILNSYLAAKWDRTLLSSVDYPDVYAGDVAASGNYDFFVGGIGQDSGQQSIGTSQGLTIVDDSFLTAKNKFVLAGVDYLLTSPTSGTTSVGIPAGYTYRSNRTWFVDTTGSGGMVDLNFNAVTIGTPVANGSTYGLLYKPNPAAAFVEVATTSMGAGQASFTLLPKDGIYALGRKDNEVALSMKKTVDDAAPNIGQTITFTLTVSNTGPALAYGVTVEDVVPARFGNIVVGTVPPSTVMTVSGNTVAWSGLSIPVNTSVSATFLADVLAP